MVAGVNVATPVPPVAAVYHNKLVPVAVKAVAVAPWQYEIGEVTVGAVGCGLTVTVVAAEVAEQPLSVTVTV